MNLKDQGGQHTGILQCAYWLPPLPSLNETLSSLRNATSNISLIFLV